MARGIPTILFVLVVVGIFAALLWTNAQPAPDVIVIVPTLLATDDSSGSWATALSAGFGSNATALPTVAVPTQAYVAPTLALNLVNVTPGTPLAAAQVNGANTPLAIEVGSTPTRPAPTLAALAALNGATPVAAVSGLSATRPPSQWQPPPLIPPISRDPYGRDHYWFMRPVDSNATNFSLYYYPYGSTGSDEFSARVHRGIDMPNPVGTTVRAAGSGTIEWAGDGLRVIADGAFENSPSYGNVVVIRHDFGTSSGQPLWTLYAHLSAVLVQPGQTVTAGEPIGLVGESGLVSGPHVHFEVRLGENKYGATVNPILWMVPYVGHGVIAGSVMDVRGNLVLDADVTIRNWANGFVQTTTSTYVLLGTSSEVNADPLWQENFAAGDIPVGRYEVTVTIEGERVSKIVDVQEGQTTFVELTPAAAATAQEVVETSTDAPETAIPQP